MATIALKATRKHTYCGKEYDAGQEYEFEIADLNPDHVSAPVYTVLVYKTAQPKEYKTREVKAEK